MHNHSTNTKKTFEQVLFEALKFHGFDLPKSDSEVDSIVRMFGETKVELPESIADPELLFEKFSNSIEDCSITSDLTAMAAQGEEGDELSKNILKSIKEDINSGKRLNSNSDGSNSSRD